MFRAGVLIKCLGGRGSHSPILIFTSRSYGLKKRSSYQLLWYCGPTYIRGGY
jgi:hypothetical protein